MNKNILYRNIPKVDVLLENPQIVKLIEKYHRDVIVDIIREEINKLRTFIKENDDKTKQYLIESTNDTDLRKILFQEFAKENITIFEMKKADATLEDAFMKLIEGGN